MNFVINISGEQQIGRAGVEGHAGTHLRHFQMDDAPVHYMEHRKDRETGKDFIAIVLELPTDGDQ